MGLVGIPVPGNGFLFRNPDSDPLQLPNVRVCSELLSMDDKIDGFYFEAWSHPSNMHSFDSVEEILYGWKEKRWSGHRTHAKFFLDYVNEGYPKKF